MHLRVDKVGRILLPKALRAQLGLMADTELEVVQFAHEIVLRPVRHDPLLRQAEGIWVHHGVEYAPIDWRRVIEEVREERLDAANRG